MNTKLITALRTAATALEDYTFAYEWKSPERCNCGVVACALTGKSPNQLKAILDTQAISPGKMTGSWTHRIGVVCPITGATTDSIFSALFEAGLTKRDIVELEYLCNPKVMEKAGLAVTYRRKFFKFWKKSKVPVDQTNKSNVIRYLRAWADLLVESGREDVVPSGTAPSCAGSGLSHELALGGLPSEL